MTAYVFPGQGAQFSGMGLDLYQSSDKAKALFQLANDTLGFDLSKIMFEGTDEQLKQTKVTQPAVFVHSVITALCLDTFKPQMVAGHSLGEFSALTAAGALSFEQGLQLVYLRAQAMQRACEAQPSTMAAVLALADEKVEAICREITAAGTYGVVVAANYNCPGQLVISGNVEAVTQACAALKAAGAKRALPLNVGGAFHSPLMESARLDLEQAIDRAQIKEPLCPIYQNVDAQPHTCPEEIKANLKKQLTMPVRWTQSVQNMIAHGATDFIELGPGEVLTGMIKKIRG